MQRLGLLSPSLLDDDANIDQMRRSRESYRSCLGAKRKRTQAEIVGLRGQVDANLHRLSDLRDEMNALQLENQANENKILELERTLKKDSRIIDLIDDELSVGT